MKRNIEIDLFRWKNQKTRLPLLLRGARQVGKSYVIEAFARQAFPHFVKVNLEEKPELKQFFETTFDPYVITDNLARYFGTPIRPGETLLFIDEIQECPKAILALRYFKENYPALHVIAAGSLLEFALKEGDFQMPVGRIESLYLKPLSFQEYLQASPRASLSAMLQEAMLDHPVDNITHQLLIEELKIYFETGGMPAIIQEYFNQRSLFDCQRSQATLYEFYKRDFGKYHKRVKSEYLLQIYQKLPYIISERFKYVKITSDLQARELRPALQALIDAGLVYQVFHSSASGLPFGATKDDTKFKLLFLDVGLVRYATHLGTQASAYGAWPTLNNGALTEQFVGQELLAYAEKYRETELYYWEREARSSGAEVDYLINHGSTILPIEVKAGTTGRLKSLQIFIEEKKCPFGIRISERPLSFDKKILSVPLYMMTEIPRLLKALLCV